MSAGEDIWSFFIYSGIKSFETSLFELKEVHHIHDTELM
jgi:hypothetical protein